MSGPRLPHAVATVAAAAVALAVNDGASAPPKPRANIVWVDHAPGNANSPVRLCTVPLGSTKFGVCYGGSPRLGQTAALLGTNGYHGTIRVTSVTPSDLDTCRTGTVFEFRFEWTDRRPTPQGVALIMAVFGMPVTPPRATLLVDRIRIPSPSRRVGEQVWLAVDADDSPGPELIATARDCTRTAPAARGYPSAEAYCISYWIQRRSQWVETRSDVLYACL